MHNHRLHFMEALYSNRPDKIAIFQLWFLAWNRVIKTNNKYKYTEQPKCVKVDANGNQCVKYLITISYFSFFSMVEVSCEYFKVFSWWYMMYVLFPLLSAKSPWNGTNPRWLRPQLPTGPRHQQHGGANISPRRLSVCCHLLARFLSYLTPNGSIILISIYKSSNY